MIDITQLVIPAVIILIPLFAGALKGYCTSKLVRIVVDFVSPTISALTVMYFLDVILINTGIVTELSVTSDIWYIGILVAFAMVFWYGFFRLVEFGSIISDRNNAGLQSDIKHGLELSSLIIGPLMQSFEWKLEQNVSQIMQKQNDNILNVINDVNDANTDLIAKCYTILELIRKQNQKIDELLNRQSKLDSILDKVTQYFVNIPHLYEILLSRVETIDTQQQDKTKSAVDDNNDNNDSTINTLLTSEDGRINRIIGHRQQDEMAQILRDAGFDVKVGHGTGEADYIIKDKDGVIIAVGSNKSYTLHNEPKRMQRRITAKDCSPELILAKKLDDTPMIIFVINRINGRKWMKSISSDELNSWNGISTPVMLAKDDEESRILIEEEFANAIVSLGGNA